MSAPTHLEVNPHAETTVPPPAAVLRSEHRENLMTRMMEHQVAKVPSDTFLIAALAAMGLSLVAELRGNSRASRFIGMWAGPLLTMGVYNKLVKTLGTR
jgi:hypothetical protein